MGFKSGHFFSKVDENLHCPLCHDVFDNPLTCKDGHTFCSECIEKWLLVQGKKECPADNRPLNHMALVRNLTVKGIIDNMDVYCDPLCTQKTESRPAKRIKIENSPNDDEDDDEDDDDGADEDDEQNCSWNGKLHEFKAHRITCGFQLVTCPNEKCKQKMKRKDLKKHKETCKYKRVVCKKCRSCVVECKLQEHLENDCPNAMVPCPNNCSTNGEVTKKRRFSMHFHVSHKCEMTIISCPFAEQGCSVKVERGKADDHLRDNISLHMKLLANENASLKNQLKKMEERLDLCNIYIWAISDFQ